MEEGTCLFTNNLVSDVSFSDIVDWIVNNLIDNTRSRRAVLKKLKEMCLLVDYKPGRKSIARQWGPEEEEQLRELFNEYRDAVGKIDGKEGF